MFYERKIKYLDYIVRQERSGAVGFVKLEVRDTLCNLTINVSDLKATDSGNLKVYLIGAGQEKELCGLELKQGKASVQMLRQDSKNIGGTGISYQEAEALRIPISAEREITCVLQEENPVLHLQSVGQVKETAEIYAVENQENTGAMKVNVENGEEIQVRKDAIDGEEIQVRKDAIDGEEIQVREETIGVEQTRVRKEMDMEKQSQKNERRMFLMENKWKQLWEIYPHTKPFRDEREYLSIDLGDFVIFPRRYFQMANNSFLLHGYHNYKHLILKRTDYQGEERYYIGVPGNFYDREKQVAVMFGFESFEGLEESASPGDFGYYLMRVEL